MTFNPDYPQEHSVQYQSGAKRPNFILPKGEYPAQITDAEEKSSKAGNPMLVVDLDVFDGERTKKVRDYIVLGGEYSADWKLGHLAVSAGLPDDGNLDAALIINRHVRVKVKVKPAKGDFQEDNAIDDYLAPVGTEESAQVATSPEPKAPAGGSDGDIPF